MKLAGEDRMVERRDAGRSHSQQSSSVRDRWFWKLYELQRFITTKCFRSHCTHSSPVCVASISVGPRGPRAFAFVDKLEDFRSSLLCKLDVASHGNLLT